MSRLRLVIVAIAGLILIALLGYILGYTVAERDFTGNTGNVRDTVWMQPDTVRLPPVVRDSLIKEPVPFPVPVIGDNDTVHDTITAMIPITQKHFVYEEQGEFWVSGFATTIDSTVFYTQHEVHYIDNTPPVKALSLTLETGVSAILADKRFAPAVYAEGGVLLWRRCKVSAGFGVAYNEAAAHGFMYGKIAYVIK